MTVIYCVSRKSRNVLSGRELFSLCSAVVEVGVGEFISSSESEMSEESSSSMRRASDE